MSDPVSVAAAYTIVLGGLALYVGSLVRRTRAARLTAQAIERERARDGGDTAGSAAPPGVGSAVRPR